jgi:hypothetical protein
MAEASSALAVAQESNPQAWFSQSGQLSSSLLLRPSIWWTLQETRYLRETRRASGGLAHLGRSPSAHASAARRGEGRQPLAFMA